MEDIIPVFILADNTDNCKTQSNLFPLSHSTMRCPTLDTYYLNALSLFIQNAKRNSFQA